MDGGQHLLDLTVPVTADLVGWPGDVPVRLDLQQSFAAGDGCTVSALSLSAHAGTHVDAPGHFLPGGGGLETIALAALVGPAWVADLGDAEAVTVEALVAAQIPAAASRVLLRTRNSARWADPTAPFDESYAGITREAASWLADRKTVLVGVDGLSAAPFDDQTEPHQRLLGAGMVVVEALDLRCAEPGWWQLACLPLRLVSPDGAPARVVIWRDGESEVRS
ncbi:MAG: cyclase family protein [Armatimonadetes bacterium]|nr:cyclase family protein [Armatimonadota bacterium]